MIRQKHGGEIPLAIAIENRDTVAHFHEGACEMHGRGCFADASLVVDDGNPVQGALPGERAKTVW